MEGSDGTCKDTEDTTMLVQIEEAKCAIRKLSCVTKLSPVRAVNGGSIEAQLRLALEKEPFSSRSK